MDRAAYTLSLLIVPWISRNTQLWEIAARVVILTGGLYAIFSDLGPFEHYAESALASAPGRNSHQRILKFPPPCQGICTSRSCPSQPHRTLDETTFDSHRLLPPFLIRVTSAAGVTVDPAVRMRCTICGGLDHPSHRRPHTGAPDGYSPH